MDYDVVIVGAGAAGMLAARDLARAGRRVALLDARDRFGGRLHARAEPRASAAVELGGEFIHGRPAITYALLREFGATAIDGAENGFVVRDGVLRAAEDDPFASTATLLASALERADDESVEALIARHADGNAVRAEGEWARRLVSGFDAADPARASARAIATEWTSDASADGAQSRPSGGYAPLVAHLARSLDPERVHVRLQTVATKIERGRSGVVVTARSRDYSHEVRARHAIVTLPLGVLAADAGVHGPVTFDPPLPAATRDAIAHIAMGPVVKVVLCFRTPVWETLNDGAWRDGAFFNGDGAFPTLWTQLPVRANTLTAWAGGPAAALLHDLSHSERIELALACAGRYFGDVAALAGAFECGYEHDWQRDPFARGAYSYVLVGGEAARETLARPIDGTLWIAGEATAADGEGGTVAGALQSGARAAFEIVARG